jgi:hypothetical protein
MRQASASRSGVSKASSPSPINTIAVMCLRRTAIVQPPFTDFYFSFIVAALREIVRMRIHLPDSALHWDAQAWMHNAARTSLPFASIYSIRK